MRYGFLLLALLSGGAFAASDPGSKLAYYGQDITSLKGPELREALFKVLSKAHVSRPGNFDEIVDGCGSKSCVRHTALGYQRAREIMFGDIYLVRSGEQYGVKDVYCSRVVWASEFRGEKPGPNRIPNHTVLNAEHTWPQSQFTRNFANDFQKSDLHHLFPTDTQMNSKRSSLDFGEVVSGSEALKCPQARLGKPRSGRATVFEPPVEHKGNVARALFYFSVRYKLNIRPEEESALRDWNRQDPVDAEEAAKNDKIFSLQKNRNPFVDYPQLADQIVDF
jgi:deoxyribonuclease-1